jgi:predicted phage terminase large subunit-like protein
MNEALEAYDLASIDRELCAKSFCEYVALAWKQVEPVREFLSNWHIDAICEHLEAVACGEIRRMVINVPPGTMKSLLCSVFWPTWVWTMEPESKWITASYSSIVSRRDALRARHLIETPWYQERWGDMWEANPDDWSSIRYSNNKAGMRLAVTVGGGVTGEHADHQLVDDPIKPLDARGILLDGVVLQKCREWWDETMSSRVVDPQTSTRTIIMQRLHDGDLSGHVLDRGDYVHVNLPMKYEPRCVVRVKHPCTLQEDGKGEETPPTPVGFKDARKQDDLIWPARFPAEVQLARLVEMGSRGVAAQDQQRPSMFEGGLYKTKWFKFWYRGVEPLPVRARVEGGEVFLCDQRRLPEEFDQVISSWDMAFKNKKTSAFVSGQVWGRKEALRFLLDRVHGQLSFLQSLGEVRKFAEEYPEINAHLIEDAANGPAIINTLEEEIPSILPIPATGSKEARAEAASPQAEAGNIYLPHPQEASWVDEFLHEITTFPGSKYKDDMDAMSQALLWFKRKQKKIHFA